MQPVMTSIDVGTSGIRASSYDLTGNLVSQGLATYFTQYPNPGWATQNPHDWERALYAALIQMLSKLPDHFQVTVMTLTGQCPSYVPLDESLNPLGPALIYQDNRAVAEAEMLAEKIGIDRMHQITGHSPWAFYILPKVLWQKAHEPLIFKRLHKIVQPTDYVSYLLTGNLVTDQTHANATLMYDLTRQDWSDEILRELELNRDLLPEQVLKPWEQVGVVSDHAIAITGLSPGIPVIVGGADSQCCCFGTGTLHPWQISEMSGSSSCLNSAVIEPLKHRAVGHYNHVVPGLLSTEMGLNTTGAALQWFISNVLDWQDPDFERAELVAQGIVPGSENLIFIPYLCDGERDAPDIKGGFYGLTMKHTHRQMLRSIYEGVSLSIRKRIGILEDAGCNFKELRVSGGGARSDLWNQIKADVLEIPVRAITEVDGAELGAAMLGAIAMNYFSSWEEAIQVCVPEGRIFWPNSNRSEVYQEMYEKFIQTENALALPGRERS